MRTPAPLSRHLGAMLYDFFLWLSIIMLATFASVALNGGEAISSQHISFRLFLLLLSFLYFGGFWLYGGQTLGMKAWRIRLLTQNGEHMHFRHILSRFCWAVVSLGFAGLGLLWRYTNTERLCFHDQRSRTRLVLC